MASPMTIARSVPRRDDEGHVAGCVARRRQRGDPRGHRGAVLRHLQAVLEGRLHRLGVRPQGSQRLIGDAVPEVELAGAGQVGGVGEVQTHPTWSRWKWVKATMSISAGETPVVLRLP